MKIEGTVVEAGTLENKGSTTCGVVVKATQAQLMKMMRLYAREVVVMPKADHDAREEGIEQLREQMGQLGVALAAREAEEERLRDVKLQRVAEGMSRWCKPQSPHLGLEAELSSALATARADADRVAALVEEAAAGWAAAAKHLADVVRVMRKIEGGTQE